MIASRFMMLPSHRDTDLPARMLDSMFGFALENGARLLFCDCRPHLINNYLRVASTAPPMSSRWARPRASRCANAPSAN